MPRSRANPAPKAIAATAAVLLAAALGWGAAPAGAASGSAGTSWPALTPAKAKGIMRSALGHQFGAAWTRGRARRLDCSTAVHPQRGGGAQRTEIRRRCRFSWSFRRTTYRGTGLVWLGGRRPDGSRHWAAQYHGTERSGGHRKPFASAGEAPFGG